jgi:hypothetical protein
VNKPHLLLLLLLLLLPAPVPRADATAKEGERKEDPDQVLYWERPPVLPDAEELLNKVRAALPQEPIRVTAELQSKDRSGTRERSFHTEMLLHWRTGAPSAEYTVYDAFGQAMERLAVEHTPGGSSVYRYFSGDPLEEAVLPQLDSPIQETDIGWVDLTLSFLWWKGGRTAGAEKVKGRLCYVVDLPAGDGASPSMGGLRLWIDAKVHLLLRATAYDLEGARTKRLEVKSLRKVDGIWMVKDLEVRSYPSGHKTLLRVRSVDLVGQEEMAPARSDT